MITPLDKARTIASAIAEKQGREIVALDVGDIIAITEVFVVTDAPSARQVRTIVDAIEERLGQELDAKPRAREGRDDASWVLLDYGDIVVHVFLTATREHYALDRLWADAARLDVGVGLEIASGPSEAASA